MADWKQTAIAAFEKQEAENRASAVEALERERAKSRELAFDVLARRCAVNFEYLSPQWIDHPGNEKRQILVLDGVRFLGTNGGHGYRFAEIVTEPCPRCGHMAHSHDITDAASLGWALQEPPSLDGHKRYDPDLDNEVLCEPEENGD